MGSTNKTEKTHKQKKQAIRAIYAAEYTSEKKEEMKVSIFTNLTFTKN